MLSIICLLLYTTENSSYIKKMLYLLQILLF